MMGRIHGFHRTIGQVVAFELCLTVFAVGLISACSAANTGINDNGSPQHIGATVAEPSPKLAPSTSTSLATTPLSMAAPSYDEIKKEIDRIMKREQYPNGPPRNYEGLADPEMAQAFLAYQESLRGKVVRNWRGWVLGVSESEMGAPDTNYDLSLQMEPSTNGQEPIGGALLEDVPHEQVRKLGFSPSVEVQPTAENGGYRVVAFDGVILGALDSGQILIGQVDIKAP